MIAIGSDHGGLDLKQVIMKYFEEKGIEYKDYGCYDKSSCDYPVYGKAVAEAVAEHLLPIQERYNDYMKNKDYLESIYKKGAEMASSVSRRTLSKVKKKVGFIID